MFMPKYDFEHYDSIETAWSFSIYFYFRSYFYNYSTCSLFLPIFPADELAVFFLLYTPLHSYLTLSVRQFALLF